MRRHVIAASFVIIPFWFALYGLPGRKAPYLEVAYLEVFDVDLVIEQNRGLEGAES
jgi:hypothetical protein